MLQNQLIINLYDRQIGRFLSVDPLTQFGGQESYSPYVAMGNQPENAVDPNGMAPLNWQSWVNPHLDHVDAGSGGSFASQGWFSGGNMQSAFDETVNELMVLQWRISCSMPIYKP